jgi:hypothetical protein
MKSGSARILLFLFLFYLAFLFFYEFPSLSRRIHHIPLGGAATGSTVLRPLQLATQKDTQTIASPVRPSKLPRRLRVPQQSQTPVLISALQFNRTGYVSSGLEKSALDAWQLGTALPLLLFFAFFLLKLHYTPRKS